MDMCRPMPAIVEDGAIQCVASVEEQGSDQVVWKVLRIRMMIQYVVWLYAH